MDGKGISINYLRNLWKYVEKNLLGGKADERLYL